jgi:hypothetical protein
MIGIGPGQVLPQTFRNLVFGYFSVVVLVQSRKELFRRGRGGGSETSGMAGRFLGRPGTSLARFHGLPHLSNGRRKFLFADGSVAVAVEPFEERFRFCQETCQWTSDGAWSAGYLRLGAPRPMARFSHRPVSPKALPMGPRRATEEARVETRSERRSVAAEVLAPGRKTVSRCPVMVVTMMPAMVFSILALHASFTLVS